MNKPRFECNGHAERKNFPVLQIPKTALDLLKFQTFCFSYQLKFATRSNKRMADGVAGVIIALKVTLPSGSNLIFNSCRSREGWGIEKKLLLADIVNG